MRIPSGLPVVAAPASHPQTSTNERTVHHRRRRARRREGIWSVLTSLPEPYGLSAPGLYRELLDWAHEDVAQVGPGSRRRAIHQGEY
mmetsp:Transcript_31733/g.94713  ORF Transcript_31733/g.94713 Transcript_31733/m.94713 type:complete len:87 (-) Transcript_31733:44-304(-)